MFLRSFACPHPEANAQQNAVLGEVAAISFVAPGTRHTKQYFAAPCRVREALEALPLLGLAYQCAATLPSSAACAAHRVLGGGCERKVADAAPAIPPLAEEGEDASCPSIVFFPTVTSLTLPCLGVGSAASSSSTSASASDSSSGPLPFFCFPRLTSLSVLDADGATFITRGCRTAALNESSVPLSGPPPARRRGRPYAVIGEENASALVRSVPRLSALSLRDWGSAVRSDSELFFGALSRPSLPAPRSDRRHCSLSGGAMQRDCVCGGSLGLVTNCVSCDGEVTDEGLEVDRSAMGGCLAVTPPVLAAVAGQWLEHCLVDSLSLTVAVSPCIVAFVGAPPPSVDAAAVANPSPFSSQLSSPASEEFGSGDRCFGEASLPPVHVFSADRIAPFAASDSDADSPRCLLRHLSFPQFVKSVELIAHPPAGVTNGAPIDTTLQRGDVLIQRLTRLISASPPHLTTPMSAPPPPEVFDNSIDNTVADWRGDDSRSPAAAADSTAELVSGSDAHSGRERRRSGAAVRVSGRRSAFAFAFGITDDTIVRAFGLAQPPERPTSHRHHCEEGGTPGVPSSLPRPPHLRCFPHLTRLVLHGLVGPIDASFASVDVWGAQLRHVSLRGDVLMSNTTRFRSDNSFDCLPLHTLCKQHVRLAIRGGAAEGLGRLLSLGRLEELSIAEATITDDALLAMACGGRGATPPLSVASPSFLPLVERCSSLRKLVLASVDGFTSVGFVPFVASPLLGLCPSQTLQQQQQQQEVAVSCEASEKFLPLPLSPHFRHSLRVLEVSDTPCFDDDCLAAVARAAVVAVPFVDYSDTYDSHFNEYRVVAPASSSKSASYSVCEYPCDDVEPRSMPSSQVAASPQAESPSASKIHISALAPSLNNRQFHEAHRRPKQTPRLRFSCFSTSITGEGFAAIPSHRDVYAAVPVAAVCGGGIEGARLTASGTAGATNTCVEGSLLRLRLYSLHSTLEAIDLYNCGAVKSDAVPHKYLSRCPSLAILSVRHTNISDEAWSDLKHLASCEGRSLGVY